MFILYVRYDDVVLCHLIYIIYMCCGPLAWGISAPAGREAHIKGWLSVSFHLLLLYCTEQEIPLHNWTKMEYAAIWINRALLLNGQGEDCPMKFMFWHIRIMQWCTYCTHYSYIYISCTFLAIANPMLYILSRWKIWEKLRKKWLIGIHLHWLLNKVATLYANNFKLFQVSRKEIWRQNKSKTVISMPKIPQKIHYL